MFVIWPSSRGIFVDVGLGIIELQILDSKNSVVLAVKNVPCVNYCNRFYLVSDIK